MDLEAIGASIQATYDALARFDDLLVAAGAEEGGVLLVVHCHACPDRRKLATVRRTTAGRLYEARLAAGVERGGIVRAREAMLKDKVGRRIPPTVGVCRVLLDHPETIVAGHHRRQENPVAQCPRHGVAEVPREDLLAALASKQRGIGIHHGAAPAG